MPYIQTRTNSKIDKEKELRIKERLGEAIRILGKSEDWLMLEFNDNAKMYFKGDNTNPIVFIDVKVLGSVNNSNEMTAKLSEIIGEELGVPSNQIYISYQGYSDWGYSGRNF